ncbi:MAG: hypothetical protein HY680_08425 [Chloroflexi bacterium]|nr:hypothetical protein [Chloroflexota bacterium]
MPLGLVFSRAVCTGGRRSGRRRAMGAEAYGHQAQGSACFGMLDRPVNAAASCPSLMVIN